MKRTFAILLLAGICLAVATLNVSHRKAAQRATQEAAWQRMRAEREAELKAFNNQAQAMVTSPIFKQTLPPKSPATTPTNAAQGAKSKETVPPSAQTPAAQVAKAAPAPIAPSGKKSPP